MVQTELDCTQTINDWIACVTTPAIQTLDGSPCLMIQCDVYDWTLAGYKFNTTDDYDVHMELHLNNKKYGYIRLGFIDNGETRDINNAHILDYNNENGYKWTNRTRVNGNDTVTATNLQGKQIKYNGWVDVDFKIRQGRIYTTYKTSTINQTGDTTTTDNEIITEQYVGTMEYPFWFGICSWISRTNGMGCRKFVVNELQE